MIQNVTVLCMILVCSVMMRPAESISSTKIRDTFVACVEAIFVVGTLCENFGKTCCGYRTHCGLAASLWSCRLIVI